MSFRDVTVIDCDLDECDSVFVDSADVDRSVVEYCARRAGWLYYTHDKGYEAHACPTCAPRFKPCPGCGELSLDGILHHGCEVDSPQVVTEKEKS